MNIVRHLQKAILMAALIAMVTFNLVQAEPVLVSVTDPVSDNTGPVDVIGMEFEFDNETGNYRILLTTTDAEPFLGDFRIDIELFNLDAGTTADDPSFFQDTINDFSLLVPSTSLILSGTNSRLLSWDTGDRILLNNLPDGTPHPDGITDFSSVVAGRPLQSLEKDVIGLDKEIAIVTSIPSAIDLLASVLPSSRSVQVGNVATAFATIINTGSVTATDCGIAPKTFVQASFAYQTTDASNALIGTPDTPVDIAAGANQSYVFAFTPTASFAPVDVQLDFDCSNTSPAPVTVGLNTLLLTADTDPVPDIVALAATINDDGIVNLSGSTGTGVFGVATVNVGSTGSITVSTDTGDAVLPVSIALCETDPATSVCINPAVPTLEPVTTSIAAGATPTFAFFVTGTDTVPFDPANNRVFVRFKDAGGVTRGSASVAIRTL
jgi:hypothetical protein